MHLLTKRIALLVLCSSAVSFFTVAMSMETTNNKFDNALMSTCGPCFHCGTWISKNLGRLCHQELPLSTACSNCAIGCSVCGGLTLGAPIAVEYRLAQAQERNPSIAMAVLAHALLPQSPSELASLVSPCATCAVCAACTSYCARRLERLEKEQAEAPNKAVVM